MIFDQLLEYNMKNIFREKSHIKCVEHVFESMV